MGFTRVRVINRNKLVPDFCFIGHGQKVFLMLKKSQPVHFSLNINFPPTSFRLSTFHSSVQSYRQSRCSHTCPISVGLIFRVRLQPLISGYAKGLPWYAWQGTDRCQPGTTDAWELIGTGPVDLQAALSVALAIGHNYTNICRHASMLLSSMYVLLVLYHTILFIAALLGLNLLSFLLYSFYILVG